MGGPFLAFLRLAHRKGLALANPVFRTTGRLPAGRLRRSAVCSTAMRNERFAVLTAGLGLLFGAAALFGANKQTLGLFHDDAVYTVVAKALYQGDGYRIISLPSVPSQTKYPFLYSYLLSWLWTVAPSFPQNIVVLKALNSALLAAIFVLSVIFYRRYLPASKFAALCFAFLVCANPIVFTFTDYVVSDLLFVALALAALALCAGSADSPASTAKIPLLAALSGLACLTRLAAAPLVLAGAVWALIDRGRRGALYFCCGVALFIAPWLLWVYLHAPQSANPLFAYYGAYEFSGAKSAAIGDWFAGQRTVVAGNARYLLDSFELLYLLPLMPWLAPFVAALTLLGAIVSARREELFVWLFFLASLALLLIWPFHPGRYVAPLVPLLVLFLFRGMGAVERWIQSRGGEESIASLAAKLIWLPVLLIFVLDGVWLSSYLLIRDEQTTRGLYGSRAPYGWRGFEESFAWLRAHTPADALLATAYDPMYFLYTGRRAIRPALHRSASYFYPYGAANPDVGSAAEIKSALDALRADYLIIDPLDGYAEGRATLKMLGELVASYGERAKIVFTSSDGKHKIYSLAVK